MLSYCFAWIGQNENWLDAFPYLSMLGFAFNLIFTQFSVFLNFVYWIVMVSLLFPYVQGPAWLILTCLHHLPYAPSRGSLFLDCRCLPLLRLLVRRPNLHELAHSAHHAWQVPHKMMSFRHFLSAFLNKPCHWLHWRMHCLPGWALSPLAIFPFTPTSPQPQLISCFINGWQFPGTQAIFLVCAWRGSSGTFLAQGSLMLQWYHYYKKYIFMLKLLLPMNIFSLWVQFF